jgi:hypothetical protein
MGHRSTMGWMESEYGSHLKPERDDDDDEGKGIP